MMHLNRLITVARCSYNCFINSKRNVLLKHHFIPTRTFINKWKLNKRKSVQDLNREREEEEITLTSIDDPNFTKAFLKGLREPDIKKAYTNLSVELNKLYDELKTHYGNFNFRIDDTKGRIDMLFTFEKEEDLKNFQVHTDSSFLQGYSSASLKVTEEGTAIFSGNICTEVPKDGNVTKAGYANFSNVLQHKAFNRIKFYNFQNYTHLVFKVRGDGRTYVVLINIHGDFEENRYYAYAHPLYTRGGPYWQVTKIPLSHFYETSKGRICFDQNRVMALTEIRSLGITALGFDGPFRLELDYVGLEQDKTHKDICPYETYRQKL